MEVSPSLFYLLLVLSKPIHGYQIMQEVKMVSKGTLTMGAGTCYGLIARCLKENLIRLVSDKDRKKVYQITSLGQQVLQEEIERLQIQLRDAVDYQEGKHD
jgi:DNA-binding PadR family transcriptional regulator